MFDGEFRFSKAGEGRYLVLIDGAVVGVIEKHVGPLRAYSGSRMMRTARGATWYAEGRKTTRQSAAQDLVRAYERAEVRLPIPPDRLWCQWSAPRSGSCAAPAEL
jgi:hypothetical protein